MASPAKAASPKAAPAKAKASPKASVEAPSPASAQGDGAAAAQHPTGSSEPGARSCGSESETEGFATLPPDAELQALISAAGESVKDMSLSHLPVKMRRRVCKALTRAEEGGRLRGEDALRWSAAKCDTKGKAQMYFLREWCNGRIKARPLLRERATKTTTKESSTSWIYANKEELMVALSGYADERAEQYIDRLLRAARTSRRHPMGPTLPRQWLVHLTSVEVSRARRTIEQTLQTRDMEVADEDAPRVIDAISRAPNMLDSPPPAARGKRSSGSGTAAAAAEDGGAQPKAAAEPKGKAKAKAKAKATAAHGQDKLRARVRELLERAEAERTRARAARSLLARGLLEAVESTIATLERVQTSLENPAADTAEIKRELDKAEKRCKNHKKVVLDQ